jgi:hypothetical protein
MDRTHNLIAGGVLVLALALPTAAQARTDRTHERIPDARERAHHLSLRFDQSKRDQDHDGLRNRGEYRNHTDPHRRDSDRDGIPDGREDADHDGISNSSEQDGAPHADKPAGAAMTPAGGATSDSGEHHEPVATVASFADGRLEVHQADGTTAVASVDGDTHLLCAPPVVNSTAVACPRERLVAGTRVLVARQTGGHWDFIVLRADPGTGATPPPAPVPPLPVVLPPAPASTGTITAVGDGSITITRPSGEIVPGFVRPTVALRCVHVSDGHAVSTEACATSNLVVGTQVALAQRALVDGGWTWTTITLIQQVA